MRFFPLRLPMRHETVAAVLNERGEPLVLCHLLDNLATHYCKTEEEI